MKKRLLKLTVLLFVVSFVYANEAPKFDKVNIFHVCPIEQTFNLEVSVTDDSSAVTLSCNLSSFPGATFVDHGNGIGELNWTPASGDEGFGPELKIIANDGALSTTKTFVLWVSPAGVPVVDIKGTTWSGRGNDFETADMAWTLYGVSADSINHLTETTWENRASGISGQASGEVPFWQLSAYELGLVEGDNLIVAAAHNDDGDVSYNGINIVYDISPPLVTITNPVSTIVITNLSGLIVAGITEEEQTEITGVSWLTTPSSTSGTMLDLYSWSVDGNSIGLTEGTNIIKVTATNSVGLTGSDSVTIILDSTPPEIVITNPANGNNFLIGKDDFVLSGYANDPDTELASVIWENQTANANGAAIGTGNWKVFGTDLELVQGSNLIVVTVENIFGITAQDTIYIIYDDYVPPVITIDFPSSGIYFTETKSFSVIGTAYDLESDLKPITWTCESGGLSGTASGIASWSENANNIGLVPGSNVFTATAENIFGLSASANCTIIYEENPPFVEIQAPNDGNNFSTGITNFMLEGIAGDVDTEMAEVTWSNELTGANGEVTGIANWTVDSSSLGMIFGENRIVVRAKNIFGYIGSDSILINWNDTTAPIVEIQSPNDGNYFVTNITDIHFAGVANDIESGIDNLTWEILPGGSKGNTTGIENWEIAAGIANVLNGTNILTVTATNGIGLATSDELIFVYDATAPEIVITNPVDAEVYSTGNDNFFLGGYVIDPDSAIVKVSWENITAGTNGLAEGTEIWNVNAENLNLKQGSNEVVVTVLIDNGNTASDSITIIFDDVTPPIIDINSPSENPLITINNSFSILGIAEDTESEISSISWICSPGGLVGQTSGLDNWNVNASQVGLQPGTNHFEVTAENKFGLTATDSMDIIYEANQPYVIITAPNNGNDYYTGTTNFVVEGIANDVDTLLLKVVWSNAVTHANGLVAGIESWSVDAGLLGLTEGRNEIIVKAENIYGLNGTEDRIIIYVEDNTAAYIYIDTPNSGETYLTFEKEFEVSGFAQDNESGISRIEWEIKPNGESGIADGIAEWSIAEGEFKLSEGSNVLTVTAYNGLGGIAEDSQVIIVDSTVPIVEILTPTTQTIYNISGINFNVGGTIVAGSSTLEKFGWSNMTTVTKGNLNNSSGTWSIAAGDLSLIRGTNVIEIYAVNGLGVRGSDSISLIIRDQELPEIEITSPGNGDFITQSPVQINGVASDDVGVYRVDVNGVNAVGKESWYASITLQPGINQISATAFDLPPSQSAQDNIMLLYGDKDKEIIDVQITGPTRDSYWETTGTNVSLAGSASGAFGVQKLIWINKSLPNKYGYTDGQSIWTAADIPLAEGTNEIMVVAYDLNDNWGKDIIMVYSSDTSATNISPVIFEKVKINRNKKVSYSVFLRDMLVIRGKISETAFNKFDVSDKENPDALSILMKGKTTTGKVLIRNWNSNERIEQASWNKVLWKETNKNNVRIKKSVGGIQIGPVKEGKMKAKFKWKKARNGKPAETSFLIKIDRQKLLGNQTDNIDSIDLSEPVEFWLGIGNTQVRGTVIFDEETFKAKQINQ